VCAYRCACVCISVHMRVYNNTPHNEGGILQGSSSSSCLLRLKHGKMESPPRGGGFGAISVEVELKMVCACMCVCAHACVCGCVCERECVNPKYRK